MAERQRRQQAESAAVLHAALAYLNRGNVCREPLTPGMFARPNLKGLQAALYLLHHRIRGAARTKKEFQHVYPVLEPSQAKEFKAAMQGWVRELGAAGMVHPDTVRFFVSAYLGSSGGHRTVFMLLDISLVALAKELGSEAPQASLPGAADVLAPAAATATLQHDRAANAAAAAARRAGQGRLDSVVAAMQRVKQLHVQAARQLAGSTAASGGEAAQLAPRVPPLFVGSQAASRRGDLFQELLAQGPPVTAKPEAVGPDSWADLVSAGRGGGGGAAAAAATMPAFGTPPAAARRLSNPAQEASNFAAKGLAADADVHTVHSVLVARLEAAAAAIQGLTSAGAATGASTDSAEVRAALAEAAAYREAFMLSARHDLAAAQLRVELQAASGAQPSLLQLLPPSLPPTNPVLEGMAAAQEAAAAGTSEADNSWAVPDDALVQALRRSMWQQALSGAGSSNQRPHASAAVAAELEARERAPPAAAAAAADPGSPLRHQPLATEGSCGSSQATRARAAVAFDSPSLADLLSNCTKGLAALPLLSGDATVEALASPAAAAPQDQNREQQSWAPSYMQRQRGQPDQQLPASPCMAESCASVSVVAENHSIHSSLAAAPAGQRAACDKPMAASPMLSAAASFMRPPQRQQQPAHPERRQSSSSLSLRPASSPPPQLPGQAASREPSGVAFSPPLRITDSTSPAAQPQHDLGSGGADAGSARRRAARITVTLTPPRRLEESPVPAARPQEVATQQQPLARFGRPVEQAGAPTDGYSSGPASSDSTPLSRRFGGRTADDEWPTPVSSAAVLQPVQQQQRQQPAAGVSSPALFASCLKSQPGSQSRFAASPPAQQSPGLQLPAGWATPAARGSPSPARQADRPASGGSGRRRSAKLHTTSSPQTTPSQFTPPRSLLATPPPEKPGRGGNAAAGGGRLGSSSAAADGAAAGFDMDALRQRLAKMRMKG